MSKSITSAAALMLCEAGKLALDDPVAKFLPELTQRQVLTPTGNRPATTTMTVRQLLLHTSGIPYGKLDGSALHKQYAQANLLDKEGTLQDLVNKLAGLPLAFDPGTDWEYGYSTDLLGAVIERVAGQSLAQFMQERLFAPLGMVDTGFEIPPPKESRFAACYERNRGTWALKYPPAESRYLQPATFYAGGGGLLSTATDYWHFLQMIAQGGQFAGQQLLSSSAVDLMTHNQLDETTGWIAEPGQGFGLGFRVLVAPYQPTERHLPGEYGWAGIASTHYWTNPQEQLTVLVLEQTLPYTAKTLLAVRRLIYAALGCCAN